MPKRADFHEKSNPVAHYWPALEADYSLDHDPRSLPRKQGINIHSASCWRTAGCVLSEGTTIRNGFQKLGSCMEREMQRCLCSPQRWWSQSSGAAAAGRLPAERTPGCSGTPSGAPAAGSKWQQNGCSCCSAGTGRHWKDLLSYR